MIHNSTRAGERASGRDPLRLCNTLLAASVVSAALAWPIFAPAFAQQPAASAPAQAAAAAARAREQERMQLQRREQRLSRDYAVQRAQCMRRFLVNDCLDAAARDHRAAMNALRVRRNQLDLLDRQQQAEEERARVRANLAAHPAVDESAVRAERARRARLEQQSRQAQLQRARPGPSEPARPRRPAGGARDVLPAASAAGTQPLQTASQARAAQAQHLRREQTYQRLQERARQQRSANPAPALPVPPASGPLAVPR